MKFEVPQRQQLACAPDNQVRRVFGSAPYQKQASTVRNEHSVFKKASWGTRRIFRSIRCKKQAFLVRKGYSVRKTGFCGTRCVFWGSRCAKKASCVVRDAFGDKKGLLGYAMHFQRPAEQPTPQTVDSLLPQRQPLQCAKRPPLGGEQI